VWKACAKCKQLNLTVESFVIDSENQRMHVKDPIFHGKRYMGTYQAIRQRSDDENCGLCRLLVLSMDKRPEPFNVPGTLDPRAECWLFWRLDGREHLSSVDAASISVVKRTRRLAIEWRSESQKIDLSYVVLVAPDGDFRADGTVIVEGKAKPPTFFLGRKLTSLEVSNTQLVKNWLDLCRKHHPDCEVDHKDARFRYLHSQPCFFVVDVRDMCLQPLPSIEAEYVALSYTWAAGSHSNSPQTERGDTNGRPSYNENGFTDDELGSNSNDANRQPNANTDEKFTTSSANVELLLKPGGIRDILHCLPVAIQNAILLTRYLEFTYIWIDSLCIIQDEEDSWQINADLMDVVYANAELTICAADGEGAENGLQALYSGPVEAYNPIYRPAADQQVIVGYPAQDISCKTLELMLSWPSNTYVSCSRWNSRAWTFQERLVSPRCLICVHGRVYLQCQTTTMSEDIYSDVTTEKGSAGWSVELHGAPAHTLKRLQNYPVGVYKDCLSMYTTRDLSREEDILNAFVGIGNLVCNYLGRPKEEDQMDMALLFGLPASHFDYALFWQPQESPSRRLKSGKRIFPSWSWSGWKCRGGITYRRAAVADLEIDLHDWLLKRTWITYYIRDGFGALRLVWDPTLLDYSNYEAEERWKGYDTPAGGWPGGSGSVQPEVDFHGRPFNKMIPMPGRIAEKGQFPSDTQFKELLHPFRGRNKVLSLGTKKILKPDKPYLQFWTYWGRFYVDIEKDNDPFVEVAAVAGKGLKRYAILDRHRDFAGTILLDEKWSESHGADESQEFIALSEARDFHESEYGDYGLYVEKDQDDRPWQLYNVLLIVRDDPNKVEDKQGDNVAYRMGLGKMYKQAFEHACTDGHEKLARKREWKEIILG